jgi:hypothetical protein
MTTESPAVPYSEIDPLPALWAWDQRIPEGELTIIAAAGGTGKGILAAGLAARKTAGRPMPGCAEFSPPGRVIMVSAEDDPHVVVAPRLIAAGADMDMIDDLSRVDGAPFTLPEHAGALREAIDASPGDTMVFLDPLAALVPYSLASVVRVRQALRPLQDIASQTGAAIVINHHLNKNGSLAGSPAVRDAVRSVLVIERDKISPAVRCIRVAKSNMGVQDVPAVRYEIETAGESARAKFVTETDSPVKGQAAILRWLSDHPGEHSGQEIAAAVRIAYSTCRVLLSRLIARGEVTSPARGWFAAVPGEGAAVTSPGQRVTA